MIEVSTKTNREITLITRTSHNITHAPLCARASRAQSGECSTSPPARGEGNFFSRYQLTIIFTETAALPS